MIITRIKLALLAGTAAAAVGFAGTAQAAPQTASGTTVSNTASVTYTVGGTSTTTNSNTATFLVDKKVNLAVAEVGGTPTYVSLGSTDQVTTFTVTNMTNSVQDFRLDATQTIANPILGTNNFNMNNLRVFVDSNGNGTYDAADTMTYIDELAPDATVTVFIVGNVPASGTPTPNTAIVSLNATAAAGGGTGALGADLTATSVLAGDSPNAVDVVFADGGSLGDLARNGAARAFDSYVVSTAAVTMTKFSTVLSDPVNLTAFPKAIPGATVQYCIVVANAGPQAATNVSVSDLIPAQTTYVPGTISVGGISSGLGACVLGTGEDDDNTGADETDPFGGSYDTASSTVHGVIPNLPANSALTVAFNVLVK